ncbi:glycerate kinase [Larkinella arboricola]|uniref:Glycerate kinase n=1 Tax=Larkinella arboricola TaxID=643671 RepID=A0A327WSA8_LARAB|nr:glycerate kinase [Larkinella arboricola]RAJ95592.1 glycerate kinase [Larkinella arboricola]
MKILLAPDKFKGSLTARQVCDAMTEGIRLAYPQANVIAFPMADGGEGTAEVLTLATGGEWITVPVLDPLGRSIEASYGISSDRQTAFIEMSQASGLRLLQRHDYNPLKANTFGTGQLILDAFKQGVSHLVLGIGGSATNDGGTGMAAALGWQFLNDQGKPLIPCGGNLTQISRILPPVQPVHLTIDVACDVTNPLVGPNGAAAIYGPQKGASVEDIAILDEGLRHLADLIADQFGVALAEIPGAGAAGGMGAGALFFLNASLKEGVNVVIEQTRFADHLPGADLVLTGEGKIDNQTLQGKLISGIACQTRRSGIPAIALCGTLEANPAEITTLGLTAAFSVLTHPQSLDEALDTAYQAVRQTTFSLIRLFYSNSN